MLCITSSFSQVSSADLASDVNFTNYVTRYNTMLDFMITNFNRNEYNSIQIEIENVKRQQLPKSDELKSIAKILKYTDVNQLGISLDKISFSYAELRKKYGEINNDVFLNSYREVIKNQSTVLPSNATGGGCRRPWRYGLCSAAVAVEGAAILAACEAASAGVATPACIAAALVFAGNGIEECSDKYCAPLAQQ